MFAGGVLVYRTTLLLQTMFSLLDLTYIARREQSW